MSKARKILLLVVSMVVLLLVLCTITVAKSSRSSTDRFLHSLTESEREQIEDFFRELIQNDCFGHTLFGNKPISFVNYVVGSPPVYSVLFNSKHSVLMSRGKKIWESYKDLLPLKNYILKFVQVKNSQFIYIINQTEFISMVNKNLDLFTSILGPQTTAENLYEHLLKEGGSLDQILHDNSILEGILLGYGRRNAIEHKRLIDLSLAIKHPKTPPWQLRPENDEKLSSAQKLTFRMNTKWQMPGKDTVVPQEGFSTCTDEYFWRRSKFSSAKLEDKICALTCFHYYDFLTDGEDEETKMIISDGVKTRKKLSELYSSGDFLEVTLKRMTGES
jgi:hypothetical protein